jgi:putative ABC transport system ATP-binding protein
VKVWRREALTDPGYAVLLEDVTKDFVGAGATATIHALRGVTLRIRPRSHVAIQGPSGSGKTTLLHILGGLDAPTSGRAVVNGWNLVTMSEAERAAYRSLTVGLVSSRSYLIPKLTVRGNVELGMIARPMSRDVRGNRARNLLEAVGMASRGDNWPRHLSAVERRRVTVACALAKGPALLLADNPAEGLDSEAGAAVIDLLLEMCRDRGTTMVLATRSDEVAGNCDVVFSLRDGRVESWTPFYGPSASTIEPRRLKRTATQRS